MKNNSLKRIQQMKQYNPPLSGRNTLRGLLLDFNERTTPPSSKVTNAIKKYLTADQLQLYPEYGELEKKIARYSGVKAEQLILTNGSDQAIDLIFRTFTGYGDTVVIPTPSFAMFTQCAEIVGNKIICPIYEKDSLSFPFKELLEMIDSSVKLIVICNPNNPTGTVVNLSVIEKIAQKAKSAIILL